MFSDLFRSILYLHRNFKYVKKLSNEKFLDIRELDENFLTYYKIPRYIEWWNRPFSSIIICWFHPFSLWHPLSEHIWRLSFWTYWNCSNSENKKRSNYISPNCSHISLSRLLGVIQVNVLFRRRIYSVHTNLVEIMYTHVYAKISNSYFPSPYKL